MYTSVPIDIATIKLRNWLMENDLRSEGIDVLVNLTQVMCWTKIGFNLMGNFINRNMVVA